MVEFETRDKKFGDMRDTDLVHSKMINLQNVCILNTVAHKNAIWTVINHTRSLLNRHQILPGYHQYMVVHSLKNARQCWTSCEKYTV